MRLKLLANGSQPWERWIRRWGLSFLVDDDILFDAFGDEQVLVRNLRRFKVEIARIRLVVVSHEHWDHVEGLSFILAQRPHLQVYLPQHADEALKDSLRQRMGEVVEVREGPVKIKDRVHVSGEILGHFKGADMPEQALVLETEKGLVVVAGCAHPGIARIVAQVQAVFDRPVHGVIGGFHLKDRTVKEIGVEVDQLKAAGVKMVAPLHCTGGQAGKIFRQAFGAGCLFLGEGQEITFS